MIRLGTWIAVLALCWPLVAKEKKTSLPAEVLRAHKVLVVVPPDAEERLSDPDANIRAQEDVRSALARWNRYEVTLAPMEADLVIAVRKGTGQFVSSTVEGNPMDRAHMPSGNIGIGPSRPESVSHQPLDDRPHAGLALGKGDDVLGVFRSNGSIEHTLEGAPLWRYQVKDGLKSPTVPAVEQFRKAVEASGRAASKNTQKP